MQSARVLSSTYEAIVLIRQIRLFLLLCVSFIYSSSFFALYGDDRIDNVRNSFEMATVDASENMDNVCRAQQRKKRRKLEYYLYISDFIDSFIEIPTSNVSSDSSTINSTYLAGRAPIYNKHGRKVGTCSASFLCMQNEDGIYTDIANFLSVNNGLIVSWFTPTKLINLELDSIVHSMITKCIVVASTKIGYNPYFGDTFDLTVSSDNKKIYFKFIRR